MLDKTKRYLVVGLGLLGGKYALELSKAGFHVDGINRSEGHLQFALDHGYIERGKTHDFEDLVREADHIIFGLYPTALIEWFRTYGPLLKPGCIFTDVSGVKRGVVEPVHGCVACMRPCVLTACMMLMNICQTNRQESGAAFAALEQRLRL